jgi:hypothetical protein
VCSEGGSSHLRMGTSQLVLWLDLYSPAMAQGEKGKKSTCCIGRDASCESLSGLESLEKINEIVGAIKDRNFECQASIDNSTPSSDGNYFICAWIFV